MIRLPESSPPKHRRPIEALTQGWTRWAKHRADNMGPASADGMEEYLRKSAAVFTLQVLQLRVAARQN